MKTLVTPKMIADMKMNLIELVLGDVRAYITSTCHLREKPPVDAITLKVASSSFTQPSHQTFWR